MDSCKRCGRGGAERSCPALESTLCASCCDAGQRRDIACPATCVHLQQFGDKDAYNSAVDKLMSFAFESQLPLVREALARLIGAAQAMEDWEQPLMFGYTLYGHVNKNHHRIIDLFLQEHRRALERPEIDALEALQHAWPTLIEVQSIEKDVGVRFVDMASAETLFVHEKTATHSLKKFDAVLGWLVRLGDRIEMTGAHVLVPRPHLESVRAVLVKELKRLRRGSSGVPDTVLLREAVVAAQQRLRDCVLSWQPPRLVTTHGEELVFCEAIFEVTDVNAARARLAEHADLEAEGPGDSDFVWLDHRGSSALGAGPSVLGTLRIEGTQLKLQTQSRERLERGKQLLGAQLGVLARHRLDGIQDVDAAMAARSERAHARPEDPEASALQAELIGPLLQKQIDGWIDLSIPALKGKTAREAVKTQAGRRQVIRMLKDQENMMQGQPGGATVDFSYVYKQLGLDAKNV